MTVISYPGQGKQYEPLRFYLRERRLPGPWLPGRNLAIKDRAEAIRTAQARIQWEDNLVVRVVDQFGILHWTNEEPPHGVQAGKDA